MRLIDIIKKQLENPTSGRDSGLSIIISKFFEQIKIINKIASEKFSRDRYHEQEVIECSNLFKKHLQTPIQGLMEAAISEGCGRFESSPKVEDIHFIYTAFMHSLYSYYATSFLQGENSKTLAELEELLHPAHKGMFSNKAGEICHDLFYIMQPILAKKIDDKIKEKILTQRDERSYTLLHLACEQGKLRLVKTLISQEFDLKWIAKSDLLINVPSPQAIAENNGHPEITQYLFTLSIQPKKKGSVKGMIALMGAAASPAKKIAVIGNQVVYEVLQQKFDETLRPATIMKDDDKIAITPGESKVYVVWDIKIDIDSPQPSVITLSLDENKALIRNEQPEKTAKEVPIKIPPNTKCSFTTTLTFETLDFWEKKVEAEESRYRDQNTTMGGFSAASIARQAGFLVKDSRDWQWCHLIAYSMGGPDGLEPKLKEEYDIKGPQRECNLVVGTVEANAQMLIVEDLIKKLIRNSDFKELTIKITPKFFKGLEKFHIAESVEYTIQDKPINPIHQITFTFDMLSRRKVTPEEILGLSAIVKDLFVTKGQLLQTNAEQEEADKKNNAEFTTPVKSSSLVLFSTSAQQASGLTSSQTLLPSISSSLTSPTLDQDLSKKLPPNIAS